MYSAVSCSSAILQVLLDGPATGPEIVDRLRAVFPGYADYPASTAYAALTPMKREGVVADRAGPGSGGRGRPPRIYELTETGRQRAAADAAEVAAVFGGRGRAARGQAGE